ncbi:MAG: leucine-rich repeat domain-containing protein [Cytophagales bacterium]|nr:leucine-rich repeat domain-containing protein [Cytophagales bacterium]
MDFIIKKEKQHIISLLFTGKVTNIDLAEQLCKGQNINFEELLEEVFHLSFWEKEARLSLKDKNKKEQLLSLLDPEPWELHINNPSVSEIPNSLGYWKGIFFINFEDTSIEKLPESIGNLHQLEWLLCGDTYLEDLPESINNLHNLKVLDVGLEFPEETIERIKKKASLPLLKTDKWH